jgi:DNA-binding NarL/FixJ family response regulator
MSRHNRAGTPRDFSLSSTGRLCEPCDRSGSCAIIGCVRQASSGRSFRQWETFVRDVRVAVHAEDAITLLGLAGALADAPGTTLVEPASGDEADVTVVSEPSLGAAATELLRTLEKPVCGFLLIAAHADDADCARLVELEVRAVLPRAEFTRERLLKAIHIIHDGQACFPPSLQGGLLDHMSRVQREILAPRGLSASGLSVREIDVLRMAADGYSNIEISKALPYSERTIKNVFYGLMKRFDLRNRTHVVSYAIRAGLI